MKERGVTEIDVKKDLFDALTNTDPVSEPMQYLNILDQYEQEDLRIRQVDRRKKMLERIHNEDSVHMRTR